MAWVIDCSICAALILPDGHSATAENFFAHKTSKEGFWVPALWWYELSNVLIVAVRRKRFSPADVSALISKFARLPLNYDDLPNDATARQITNLSERYSISAYDAAYLELAQRKGIGLATLDKSLASAAHKSGTIFFKIA